MLNKIKSFRFHYESILYKLIENRLGPAPFIEDVQAQNFLSIRKQNLLGDAVCITEDLLPEIHKVYRSCLKIFGDDLYGELFVQQSHEYNANVFAYDKKFDLLINSSLIKEFSLDELCFVIGHELGHVFFGHSKFPVHEIMRIIEKVNPNAVSPETKALLFSWSRATEISADRIGLLCCGKLLPAVKALFKTSSGLLDIDIDKVLRSFRNQYNALEKHIQDNKSKQGWMRSHPMMPIRFKALELAALDIVSFRQNPKSFKDKSFRYIDNKISAIFEQLENYISPI